MPVPVKVRASFVYARPRDERRYSMDGETNGSQEATQGAQDQAQEQQQEGTQSVQEVGAAPIGRSR